MRDRVILTLYVLGFLACAVTGFVGWLGFGALVGWWLLAHLLAAPLFLLGLVLAALFWAERCVLAPGAGPSPGQPAPGWRCLYWLALASGFVCAATMTAAMLPLFGYAAQVRLLELHRISGVVLAFVALAGLGFWIARRAISTGSD